MFSNIKYSANSRWVQQYIDMKALYLHKYINSHTYAFCDCSHAGFSPSRLCNTEWNNCHATLQSSTIRLHFSYEAQLDPASHSLCCTYRKHDVTDIIGGFSKNGWERPRKEEYDGVSDRNFQQPTDMWELVSGGGIFLESESNRFAAWQQLLHLIAPWKLHYFALLGDKVIMHLCTS